MKIDFIKKNQSKLLWTGFLVLGLFSALLSGSKETPNEVDKKTFSADTFIPPGFVLVPIEVANAESLSSLLGDLGGVVDLYLPHEKGSSTRVASKLKILRAPYNPDLYAVLVKENESNKLLTHAGSFVAVVQNPKAQGSDWAERHERKIKIEYQN